MADVAQLYAVLDEDGFPRAFYHSQVHAVIPPEAIEITAEQHTVYLECQGRGQYHKFVNGALVPSDTPPRKLNA